MSSGTHGAVCTVTSHFYQGNCQQEAMLHCCNKNCLFLLLLQFNLCVTLFLLLIIWIHVLSSPLVAAEMVCTLCFELTSNICAVLVYVWSMLHVLSKPVWCCCTPVIPTAFNSKHIHFYQACVFGEQTIDLCLWLIWYEQIVFTCWVCQELTSFLQHGYLFTAYTVYVVRKMK